jgi:hypothetical protein
LFEVPKQEYPLGDINTPQRMDIVDPTDAESAQILDDTSLSTPVISANPADKVRKPRKNVAIPAPVRQSERIAEQRGRTQPSLHAIYPMDPTYTNPYPVNIEDSLARWDHSKWRIAGHDELTKMDQCGAWTVVHHHKDIIVVDTKWVVHIKNPGTDQEMCKARIVVPLILALGVSGCAPA